MFFFAWVDEGTGFDPDAHSVEDEAIYSITLTQAEGDYATLTLEIDNPGIGLLSPGHKQWAWFSEDGTPLFYGRIDAAPDDIVSETITVELIAEPIDGTEQKAAIAAALRVPPYWDRAWVQEDVEHPDTVLETYTASWHGDRITHEISVSDILNGEDGTIEILADEHFYDIFNENKTGTTLKTIYLTATAKWNQRASGEVDLTDRIYDLFRNSGSPFPHPNVGSLTSQGLADDWPQPLTDLGGGWAMAANSAAYIANYIGSGFFPVTYLDRKDEIDTDPKAVDHAAHQFGQMGGLLESAFTQYQVPLIKPATFWKQTEWDTWDVSFPIVAIFQKFTVGYVAERERNEIVNITLSAATQRLYYDPGADAIEKIEISSDFIDQPVDDGGALPIVDPRRNCYFPTDRGQISIQYFLLLMRAKLVYRARAVHIEFETEWQTLAAIISCRKNILLHDPRLPGGRALGKVISYTLTATAETKTVKVLIGCAIGYGIELPEAVDGENRYADDYANNWTETIDPQIDVIPGVLQYDGFDGAIVLDDDGVDFFNMTPNRVINTLTITNGIIEQRTLVHNATRSGVTDPDPIGTLRDHPTKVSLQLVPVTGGAFLTSYNVTVADLVIPKMIDLEAA